VGLMDVDFHGPNTLKMLGLEGEKMVTRQEKLIPLKYSENLQVVSISSLLDDSDTAVIWRGPLKIGVIRQFITDVRWDPCDVLIIDSPPGTGDEPLTVAQTIPDAKGIIVTTPQEVSILDVRKSITFCRQVNMTIAGIVENMSGFTCPHCGKNIDLFSSGGGEKAARELNLPFLGALPFDPQIVIAGDKGKPVPLQDPDGPSGKAFRSVVETLLQA
ncbi:MAG: Mrp/NBP35 family ATP-binding protein, partial [Spirochaetales bacterium]|nr:Mrp/NBP35 family ATP-binding protein [Spirochaetales bacterium]